jgi:Ca-activated chloride channel family protein
VTNTPVRAAGGLLPSLIMRVRFAVARTVAPVLALAGVVAGGTAVAVPRAEAGTETPPRIQLVLDLSGSMQQNDAGGMTRLAAAKKAVGNIVDAAPAGVSMGVRVYGATYPGQDKTLGCQDTQAVVPIGPMDTPQAKSAAKQAVAGLDAKGFTPIGVALRAAGADLGAQGERRIILVSDGEDTCAPPPPCEVARELRRQGVELAVDVVGFRAGAARAELECIAREGGGAYVDADDAAELGSGLSALFRRQWRTYPVSGTPVQGSTGGCTDAPMIGPGQYVDRFVSDRDLFYRVKKRPDQLLQVSATVVLTHSVGRASHITVIAGPYGARTSDQDSWVRAFSLLTGWNNILSAGGRTQPNTKTRTVPPGPNDEGCVKIRNNVNGPDQQPLPVELLIGLSDAPPGTVPAGAEASATPAPPAPPATPVTPRAAASAARDDDGPGTGLLAGLAAGALLVGALTGAVLAARRRTS